MALHNTARRSDLHACVKGEWCGWHVRHSLDAQVEVRGLRLKGQSNYRDVKQAEKSLHGKSSAPEVRLWQSRICSAQEQHWLRGIPWCAGCVATWLPGSQAAWQPVCPTCLAFVALTCWTRLSVCLTRWLGWLPWLAARTRDQAAESKVVQVIGPRGLVVAEGHALSDSIFTIDANRDGIRHVCVWSPRVSPVHRLRCR